ncbi:MAG TPA: carboxypeptidase-like regulatory domain-containing protein, partial [Longimicrobiales bacterium]|nr:carboxypeptidase-like regulatory domain-containing protein [Longimicrobiales bacterium]
MNKRKTALLLLAGALALPVGRPLQAQQAAYTISGRAHDAETNAPLSGVQVSIRNYRTGALTNAAGQFSFIAQLAPGTYVVEAQMIGRETATQSITLGSERSVVVPEFSLRTTALALGEIVVTGTSAPTARRAIGNSVSTVEGRALNEAPATTIDQALQGKVAGAVITSNTGTPGGGVSVRLRGTSS